MFFENKNDIPITYVNPSSVYSFSCKSRRRETLTHTHTDRDAERFDFSYEPLLMENGYCVKTRGIRAVEKCVFIGAKSYRYADRPNSKSIAISARQW